MAQLERTLSADKRLALWQAQGVEEAAEAGKQ